MIRQICALAALSALILQGSSGGHMLLVEHTRCAEHGELVHGDAVHHHASSAHAETAELGLGDLGGHDADTAHDHCAVTADRRDAVVALSTAQLFATARDAIERRAAVQAQIPPWQARFRVAPKTSPPA